ncbi:ABC-type Fe3+ transport system, periplasmic component [Gottschalkia purinilytica]|uniref:ABC-type Fe3+ transport system, periplasmic component n=1 Tax=Gottschalkia purinilytica TaxID=1503 RepID=A0A0L0WDV9_GOTPU|nr:ABC transporter substrate-binding protein [Gottschalkia purinilytica]KNF09605.1 ABC-type Fe3+ transport system, periplasmic component [Gottschalkia purinilytica]
MRIKKLFFLITLLFLIFVFITGCSVNTKKSNIDKKELVVYTSLDENDVKKYIEDYNKKYPDVDLKIVRESNRTILNKLIKEKRDTKADIVWGISPSGLLTLDRKGLLDTYIPKDIEIIFNNFRRVEELPTWIGNDIWEPIIIVDNNELKKRNLSIPRSYEDLIKLEYKGLITMSNPETTGSGYLIVSSILKLKGEQEAWKYLNKLSKNINNYSENNIESNIISGSKDNPIGILFGYKDAKKASERKGTEVVILKENYEHTTVVNALIKKDNIKKEAKDFLDLTMKDRIVDSSSEKDYIMTSIGKHLNLSRSK